MHSKPSLLCTFVVAVCCTLCAAHAVAQTYYVQSADYGWGNQRVDVTNTVRRLVNGPDFRVNNNNLGADPAIGRDKNLRIVGRMQNGRTMTFTYNEGAIVPAQMFSGYGGGGGGSWNPSEQTWWVQSASYGSGSQWNDVTATVRNLANGPNFRVNNQTMGGDPVVGADKTLRITGRNQSGNIQTFNYREGSTVNAQMFAGGGGAGWGGGGSGGGNWNGSGLRILNANYVPVQGSGGRDVTDRLQGMIRNNRLNVDVNNKNMGGDPALGTSKKLMVVYQFQGRTNNVTVPEGGRLSIP